MGTTVSVQIVDALPPGRAAAHANDVFAFLRLIDARFSTYKVDSEVSRIRAGTLRPADSSAMLREVLDQCATLWDRTAGFFDAYATGGLDPSGFVKGWAVQLASDRLLDGGCVNHCVNAGGDLRVRGLGPDGDGWRVAVRHPWSLDEVCCVVTGTDLAVATSGVYERGRHVIDPFTGRPAVGLRSVTVTGPDLGAADAYATAALAMGAAGATWLLTVDGYEAAVITDDGALLHTAALPLAEVPVATGRAGE